MDRLFVHVLRVIQENQSQIEQHWLQIQNYLISSGKKTAKTMNQSMPILKKHLFQSEFLFDEELFLLQIKYDWQNNVEPSPSSPFVLTMLENSIHRAVKDVKHDKDTQAVQYVFMKINEFVLSPSQKDLFTLEVFLKQLIESKQFSFHWIAMLNEQEGEFFVE